MTKFDELVALNHADFLATYEYARQVVSFASIARQRIVEHLECQFDRVQFLGEDNQPQINPHGTAKIDDEGNFNFRIYIDLGQGSFNINECGKDFFHKGLVPPRAVILNLGVKQEGTCFRVKAPSVGDGEIIDTQFLLANEDSEHWHSFLESCFQSLKLIAGQNLDARISNFVGGSGSNRAFGFQ